MAKSTFNRHKNAIEEIFGIYIESDRTDGCKYYIGNADVLEENPIQLDALYPFGKQYPRRRQEHT